VRRIQARRPPAERLALLCAAAATVALGAAAAAQAESQP